VVPVIDQGKLRGAIIAEPIVFDTSLLLPGTNKRRYRRLSWFGQSLCLYQKQFSIPEPEERLRTLRIRAVAEHEGYSDSAKKVRCEQRELSFSSTWRAKGLLMDS